MALPLLLRPRGAGDTAGDTTTAAAAAAERMRSDVRRFFHCAADANSPAHSSSLSPSVRSTTASATCGAGLERRGRRCMHSRAVETPTSEKWIHIFVRHCQTFQEPAFLLRHQTLTRAAAYTQALPTLASQVAIAAQRENTPLESQEPGRQKEGTSKHNASCALGARLSMQRPHRAPCGHPWRARRRSTRADFRQEKHLPRRPTWQASTYSRVSVWDSWRSQAV